jgi:hypothetical protein
MQKRAKTWTMTAQDWLGQVIGRLQLINSMGIADTEKNRDKLYEVFCELSYLDVENSEVTP